MTTLLTACAEPLLIVIDGLDRAALDWRPAPDSRSIGEIARHVLRVDNTFLRRIGVEPRVDDPGQADAPTIAAALADQQAQVRGLLERADAPALDTPAPGADANGQSIGDVLVHMAQHHLYHLAQLVYLRRALDRDWTAPLDRWEHATHLIGAAVLAAGPRAIP